MISPLTEVAAAAAAQRRSDVAQEFQPRVETRSEIDERSNRLAIRKQGLSVKVRKHLVGDAEAVRPDQPAVFLDAPAIGYVPADHLLAVRGASQHEPLESKQLRPRRELDFCRPAEGVPN